MRQLRAQLVELGKGRLGGYVAHQRVLGEGTTSEAAQSHVKPVAARLISCCDLFCGLLRTGVQVGAELNVRDGREHRAQSDSICPGLANPTVSASEISLIPISCSLWQAVITSSCRQASP